MIRAKHWFKLQYGPAKCRLCERTMEEGDRACYDADKNLLCETCGMGDDDD